MSFVRLDWAENDSAPAPQGGFYGVNSEQSRGETRVYWAEYTDPISHIAYTIPSSPGPETKAKAKTAARRDAQRAMDRPAITPKEVTA